MECLARWINARNTKYWLIVIGMRTAYTENLDAFAHEVLLMCDKVKEILNLASAGLLNCSLHKAEQALSLSDELEALRRSCSNRAMGLLALESPVARDLRQVVSSIYIVENFNSMGRLAKDIARIARNRHPEHAVPEECRPYISELTRLNVEMLNKVRDLLIHPNADHAVTFEEDDDAVDDIHRYLMQMLTTKDWKASTREAVELALMAKYFERFGDHAVDVASRIVFLTTGLEPDAYLDQRSREEKSADISRQFQELMKQLDT